MRSAALSIVATSFALLSVTVAPAQVAKVSSPVMIRAAARIRPVMSKDVLEAARRSEDQAHARVLAQQKAAVERALPKVKAEIDAHAAGWRAAAQKAGLDEKAFEADMKAFAAARTDTERARARAKLASYEPVLSRFRAAAGITPDSARRFAAAAGLPAGPPALPPAGGATAPGENSITFAPPFSVFSASPDSSADADGNLRAHYASIFLWWGENRAAYTFVVDLDPAVSRVDVMAAAPTTWEADAVAALGYADAAAGFTVKAQIEGQEESCQASRGGRISAAGFDTQTRSGRSPSDPPLRCSLSRAPNAGTRLDITVWVQAAGSSIVGGTCSATSTAKLERVVVDTH